MKSFFMGCRHDVIHFKIPSVSKFIKCNFSKNDLVNVHQLKIRHLIDFESELKFVSEVEQNYSDRQREPKINLHSLRELVCLLSRHDSFARIIRQIFPDGDIRTIKNKNLSWNFEKMTASDWKQYFIHKHCSVYDRHYQRLQVFILYYCFLLPNKLHIDTPRKDTDVMLHHRISKEIDGNDHIDIGHKLNVLFYENCASYFLLNEAAIFEIAIQRYLCDILPKELEFKPFLNPDSCHDFVCFGVLAEPTMNEGFLLENSVYRLTGSASLGPFCAYRCGETAHSKYMPERFFARGRRYIPPTNGPDVGLYSVAQRTNVHLIIMTSSKLDMQSEFQKTLSWLITLYERLNFDFRVCYKRASELRASESLRASIELYSLQKKDFIEAASLSSYDDFISRRLRILHHDKNKNYGFVWIIDGVTVSVPIILAHLLERSKYKLEIPECIRPYMYVR